MGVSIPAILAAVSSIPAAVAAPIAAGAADLGIPAAIAGTAGTIGADALLGAGLGAGEQALTGGKPLKGAEFGGLGGAALGGISSLLGGAGGAAGGATAGAGAGGVGSAAGIAAPAGVGAGLGAGDVTLPAAVAGGGDAATAALGGAFPSVGAFGETAAGAAPSLFGAAAPAAGAAAGAGGILGTGLSPLSAAGLGLGVGGIAYDAIKGNQPVAGEKALQGQATALQNQGSTMEGYLNSGTLPPGLQQSLTSASDAAVASIKSQYASRGMSGSSAEQQDIQRVSDTAVTQGAQIAMQLYSQGVAETGMADQIYAQLMQTALQQDQALGQAVGNFAGALTLSGRPVTTTSTGVVA